MRLILIIPVLILVTGALALGSWSLYLMHAQSDLEGRHSAMLHLQAQTVPAPITPAPPASLARVAVGTDHSDQISAGVETTPAQAGSVQLAAQAPPAQSLQEVHMVVLSNFHPRIPPPYLATSVVVDRPGHEVVLVLGVQRQEMHWTVTVTPDTHLRRILLGGTDHQILDAYPPGTAVEDHSGLPQEALPLVLFSEHEDGSFANSIGLVQHLTGSDVASFDGGHRSHSRQWRHAPDRTRGPLRG